MPTLVNSLERDLLARAETYLQQCVGPKAAQLDRDPKALQQALQGLGERQLLGLRVPEQWQGAGLSAIAACKFRETVAQYSGALAFIQTQHQSAARMLSQSQNESLKQQYLSDMSQGNVLVGIGYSQLRRPGQPMVRATPIEDGTAAGSYCLEGEIPWVTGAGFFQAFIVGATLPEGQAMFGWLPLATTTQVAGGRLTLSEPLQLAAMHSTNTVKARLENWILPSAQVVGMKPAGWIHRRDRHNALQHSFFALGCARAGLDILDQAQTAQLPFIATSFAALNDELNRCRTAIYQSQQDSSSLQTDSLQTDRLEHQLELRAWAIELAVRCAHAAVAVSRGSANYSHHAAQRVYREALAFTVFGQTSAVMEATLARIVQR